MSLDQLGSMRWCSRVCRTWRAAASWTSSGGTSLALRYAGDLSDAPMMGYAEHGPVLSLSSSVSARISLDAEAGYAARTLASMFGEPSPTQHAFSVGVGANLTRDDFTTVRLSFRAVHGVSTDASLDNFRCMAGAAVSWGRGVL